MDKKTLLLNHVTSEPVGHVLEAIQAAKGLSINDELEIHVALNSKTAYELTSVCNWIKETYPIDMSQVLLSGKKARCYRSIPRKWDYIINDQRQDYFTPHYIVSDSFKCNNKGAIYSGYVVNPANYAEALWGCDFPPGIEYAYINTIIQVPESSRDEIRKLDHPGVKICLLLAGSGRIVPGSLSHYPSMDSWIEVISAINNKYPNCMIYITGVTNQEKGRTNTRAFPSSIISKIVNCFSNVKNMYDIGLWNQVALLEFCDVLISPHTGFAFLASRVNTPWLEIAEGGWRRYLWNKVPFYSVFPDDPNYPYLMKVPRKIAAMEPSNFRKKIPDILEGLSFLLDSNSTYEESVDLYIKKAKTSNIIVSRMRLNCFPWYSSGPV
jgi:hypothetical protein